MAWIKSMNYDEANDDLKRVYNKVKGPDNYLDNILTVHSLRPHTLKGHMQLYKNVLHHSGNTLPKWYLETLGVYVSYLNDCRYCVEHHFAGLCRIIDSVKANSIRKGIETGKFKEVLDQRMNLGMQYAKCLTESPSKLTDAWIKDLLKEGFSEGEILEINQVVSYFNYANRTVLGLGVTLNGDVLGMSPNDSTDPNNWQHN